MRDVIEVFRHADSALVALHQSVLEDAGIQTFVRNIDYQQSLVRGLLPAFFPLPIFFPTLCVVNDADYAAAREILASIREDRFQTLGEWKCAQCAESVPGNFDTCWSCGSARSPGSRA